MDVSVFLRKYFWAVPFPLVAIAAYLNAQAVTQLVGVGLSVDEHDLAKAPNVGRHGAAPVGSGRDLNARTILQRNVFDHVTGDLATAPTNGTGDDSNDVGTPDISDPMKAPACDGVNVKAIVGSTDEEWSFASIAGSDGKSHLARRGTDIGGKKVYFIGWDRIWFTGGSALCQALLFDPHEHDKPPVPPPVAAPPAGSAKPRMGAQPLAADLKQGIQKVSDTEWNIDRGTLDKILENQAELMRQARIIPVQENGKTIGVKLNGVKPDALLGVIGLQNGDTLKSINGFEMGSPEKALEAYARLRTANKLTIAIDRAGKPVNMDYNIK